jgi:thioredoxin-dependent adenylylsulfate APS reductase
LNERSTAVEVLAWVIASFGDEFAIATSFQKEGLAIVDMAWRIEPRVRVLTLDTGRLPDETYRMVETVRERYGISVELVKPDAGEVGAMVRERGLDLFYETVENRRLCCEVRKVRPLERKLATLRAWASGMRRDQSETRVSIGKVEEAGGRVKVNPLADWTAADVERYTREYDVPVHPLYAAGYRSIGCAPCTRAVEEGEEERAGRWWWEEGAAKECGIHFQADGSVKRGTSESAT